MLPLQAVLLRLRAIVCPRRLSQLRARLVALCCALLILSAAPPRATARYGEDSDDPQLKFANPELYYLPRDGRLSLTLNSRRVTSATVKVHQLLPGNLPMLLNRYTRGYAWSEGNDAPDLPSPMQFEQLSRELTSFTLPIQSRDDAWVSTTVQLASSLKKRKGVFLVRAESFEQRKWGGAATAHHIVLQTRLGVLAHWTEAGAVAFVHDLGSMKPHAGARITLYSSKNQLLASERTDRNGLARLSGWDSALGEPTVLIAEQGEDYAFLKLEPRDGDAQQLPEDVQEPYRVTGYQAFLYADRELYRPGEPVHLRWLVRNPQGEAVGGLPLQLRVLKPNGKPLLTEPVKLSDLGTGSRDLQTERAFPTGTYTVELRVPGGEEPLGSYTFSLEDFVPVQIRAELRTSTTLWTAGVPQTVQITAAHLYGAPAAGMRAEAWLTPSRGAFQFPGYEAYTFDNDSRWQPSRIELGEQTTDADGVARFVSTPQLPAEATMPLSAQLGAYVYELGGRPVSAHSQVTLFPPGPILGLKLASGPNDRGVTVGVVALTTAGLPASLTDVRVVLERRVWSNSVRRFTSHYQSNWDWHYEAVTTQTLKLVNGSVSTTLMPPEWDECRVRVYAPGVRQYSTRSFYSYDGRCEITEPDAPSLIKLTLDKEQYQPGDEARLRIESPYDGRALVVLQGERFHEVRSVEIRNRSAELRFTVKQSWLPNCWVEVTAIHVVNAQNVLLNPFSSFAALPLKMQDPRRQLDVGLGQLPEQWEPGSKVAVDLTLSDSRGRPVEGEITLAAVDEGIHLIRGYENPDPCTWLERLRRPELRRTHYYDKIAYDFIEPEPGGDGDGMGSRLDSPGESWIKPVALWSGDLRTGPDGRVQAELTLPEFSGQLRLVAVAASRAGMGFSLAQMFVRRPWTLRAGMPRFGLPGDRFRASASLDNRSTQTVQVRLWAEADGAAAIEPCELTRALAPGATMATGTTVTLPQRIGQAELRWHAEIQDASGAQLSNLRHPLPLPVRPPAAWQSLPGFVLLPAGGYKTLTLAAMAAEPGGELRLQASLQPLRRLQQALRYVINYPYGCVEQTTSRLLPLYLLRRETGLLGAIDLDGKPFTPAQLDTIIREGIDRLFTMQTDSGGLGYWPGAIEASYYGSIYALHCLTLIEQGGEYTLPAENMEALRAYVRRAVLDGGQGPPVAWVQQTRAYGLFVLVLGGDTRAAVEISRLDNVALPQHSRLLLAAALAQASHDPARVQVYLKQAKSIPEQFGTDADPERGSWPRNRALELLALGTANPQDPTRHQLARALSDWLAENHYGNTHESALIITALAEYLRQEGAGSTSGTFSIKLADGTTTQGSPLQDVQLRATGAGARFDVSNTSGSPLYLNWMQRGVPLKASLAATTSPLLTLNRRLLLPSGAPVTSSTLAQMSSCIVELELRLGATKQHVVVTDLLPAGLEVANPRLDGLQMPATSLRPSDQPAHLELRDDRVVIVFDALTAGTHRYYYTVQAVTPGRFVHPPAAAEVMYDAAVRATSAGGALHIEARE